MDDFPLSDIVAKNFSKTDAAIVSDLATITIEQVSAARAEIVAKQQQIDAAQWWARVQNEIVNPMLADGTTVPEIKKAIAKAE